MRTLPALLIVLLAAAGCDSTGLTERERAEVQAGDVQIEFGETAVLDGLTIRFDAIVEDSRCPLDVVCVWEGVATVNLTVDGDEVELNVVDPADTPEAGLRIGDLVVYAVALAPYPRQNDPIDATPVVALSAVAASE